MNLETNTKWVNFRALCFKIDYTNLGFSSFRLYEFKGGEDIFISKNLAYRSCRVCVL